MEANQLFIPVKMLSSQLFSYPLGVNHLFYQRESDTFLSLDKQQQHEIALYIISTQPLLSS